MFQANTALAQEDDGSGDRIVVTGTRITSGNLTSPVPVSSVDAEYIQRSGENILTDVLAENPALISSDSGNGQGDDGIGALNLRNLGEDRTLTLVNGRRHIASAAGTASVDTNTIPTALVERVDVLTGGASAIYGADGVSGVINFIMKDDFEGADFSVRTNMPNGSGGKNYLASATVGTNFDGGRGNVAVNFEYFRQDGATNFQRGQTPGLIEELFPNPADPDGSDPNLPDELYTQNTTLVLTSENGVIYTGEFDIANPTFTAFGEPFDTGIEVGDESLDRIGGDGLLQSNAVEALITNPQDRYTVNLLSRYELNDNVEAYGEFKYVNTNQSRDRGAETIFDSLPISFDNPFIPAGVVLDPIDIVGTPLPALLLGRDNFDLSSQPGTNQRDLYRVVGGIRGAISEAFDYDISYVFGRVNGEAHNPETAIEDRLFAALDAVDDGEGNIVCRSNLDPDTRPFNLHDLDVDSADGAGHFTVGGVPTYAFSDFTLYNIDTFGDPDAPSTTFTPGPNSGCEPLNLFGNGSPSPEAIAFVTLPTTDTTELTQHVLTGFISGDTSEFFELPAGPIGVVAGFEYRKEESRITRDELNQRGATNQTRLPNTAGSFDVYEVFGEFAVPVVSGQPLFEDLSVGGAVRWSDYSTVGSTLTWRANSTWAVTEDILFRGSYSRAIRAPNINELFQPGSADFFEPEDPCLPSNRNLGSSTRVANCTADLASVGIALEDYTTIATGPFVGFESGNPNLDEETADSWTVGGVFTPSFIPGLSIAVDYWNIEIENAIIQAPVEDIINACYDAPTLDNVFCETISRSSTTGNIRSGSTRTENVAFFETSGIDLEARYGFDVADLFGSQSNLGDVGLRLAGTRAESLSTVRSIGGEPIDSLGVSGDETIGAAPRYVLNFDLTWSLDRLSVNYQYRYQSSLLRPSRRAFLNKPDLQFPLFTRPFHNHDISVNYQVNDNIEIYGGVNNLARPSREVGFTRRDRVLFFGANFSTDTLGGLF